ncbi:hypothetical protein PYK79_20530 [Streptomyces sp. ID05-04B]|uniref:hypothetical protein n=1 Tax=Streptomyces sp. ID05-04B TaxID=3028661 RepID=UPI0029C3AE1F|nr:hypothetical protein [Streptomyces sp. ID05-04B]MDX5565237.1 hypothetical protein [Streptomyces sp. ID05-04B]
MTPHPDRTPVSAEDSEPTQVLGDTTGPTQVLGGVAERAPSAEPGPDDAEYSATVLASHWIQRPAGADTTLVAPLLTQSQVTPPLAPDRVEGTVLRFGPGVTAAVAERTHRTLPSVPAPPAPSRRRLRRHALPALVLIGVIAFLAWQRLGPSLETGAVQVMARPAVVACNDTADVVGLVATNGRPGTLTYRWVRSDGTSSGVLREVVAGGQRQARLHLLWTFQGRSHYAARAELHLLSPVDRTVVTDLTYDCP